MAGCFVGYIYYFYRQKLSESVKRSWAIRKQKLFCNGGSK